MVRLIPPLSLRWIFPEQGAPAAPAALVLEDTAIWAWSDNATAIDGNGDAAWKKDGDFRAGSFITGRTLVSSKRDAYAVAQGRGEARFVSIDIQSGAMSDLFREDAALLAVDGSIVITRGPAKPDGAVLRCFESSAPGKTRWQIFEGSEDGSLAHQASLSGGKVFIARRREICAVEVRSGDICWCSSVADLGGHLALDAFPMVTQEVCVVATKAWTAAFDATTGRRLWSTPIWGSRVVYGDRVYVIQDDTFYAFDLFDGSSKVEYNLRPEMEKKGKKKFDRISTHIAASDTHVWGGDPYGTLWALNRETGRPEWHHRPKGTTGYSGSIPAISGSRLYIPSFSMDARFPPSLYCYEQS